MSTADYVQRVRITFSKDGPARFISHLDVARTWERALNRARIPVAYTHGFNRRPRMQFASALPLGVTSGCELIDILLTEQTPPDDITARLMAKMAPGIGVIAAQEVALRQRSLPAQTTAASYIATLKFVAIDPATLAERVAAFLAADSVIHERQTRKRGRRVTKSVDVRPLVQSLEAGVSADHIPTVAMRLQHLPSATGRPDTVLRVLDIDPHDTRIHRTAVFLA